MTSNGGTVARWPAAGGTAGESGITEQKPRENRSGQVKQNEAIGCAGQGRRTPSETESRIMLRVPLERPVGIMSEIPFDRS